MNRSNVLIMFYMPFSIVDVICVCIKKFKMLCGLIFVTQIDIHGAYIYN